MVDRKVIIRSCLLYEFKLGSNASEACRKICLAFGEDSVKERNARNWFQKFRSGDETLEDEPRSGRPDSISNDELKKAIESDSSLTCQELGLTFNTNQETIRKHLHQIGKRWKISKWVPHALTSENRLQRLTMCYSHISRLKIEPFFDRILTCDEKWLMYTNPKRRHHWLSPTDALPQVPKAGLFSKKILLCVWWTCGGIIHHEYLKMKETINSNIYCDQLERVHEKLLEKQPAIVNRKKVLFLQDNARPHVARQTINKITQLGWEIMCHPPYSPDLSPTDFHLFFHLDNALKKMTFKNETELKSEVSTFFSSKPVEFYKDGITKLQNRWDKVIQCDGHYFDE
ncbi:hypothetical protein [Sphingomonas sp. IW22]|uniref:hypothetical protein n=1 Tax=Sphingomonas sp. IW22 TaxID=3242489 RepID=UPI00352188E1